MAVQRCTPLSEHCVGAPRLLIDLVASALQTRRHRPVVVTAGCVGIARNSASRLRRIEARLALGPTVTLELVRRLLFLGLTILGINHPLGLPAVARWRPRR